MGSVSRRCLLAGRVWVFLDNYCSPYLYTRVWSLEMCGRALCSVLEVGVTN